MLVDQSTPPTRPMELTTRPVDVPAIGADLGRRLALFGLTNVGKLIAHLPSRHEKEQAEAPIGELSPGAVVSARGEVTSTRVSGFGRRRRFEAVLTDGTGRLDLIFFNQPYLAGRIHAGTTLRVQGAARAHGSGVQMANPRYEILREGDDPTRRDARIRPVYPAAERVSSREIEHAIGAVLDSALPLIEDHLPREFVESKAMPELAEAYRMMHAPRDADEPLRAHRRLAYDELLLLQLGLAMKRAHLRETLKSPALRFDGAVDRHIRDRLPFTLTPAQDKVVGEVAADLSTDRPTNRLIQGDVGSGKTLVALYAMLMAVASGKQAALMVPTSLLAEQHFTTIGEILRGSNVRTALLTGATAPAERAELLAALETGDVDLLIGTHALLTESVVFKELAVAVIDEQHRFGVHQRATLRAGAGDDKTTPHVLVMTATPIPRTLAISLFGDLDISTIDALPPGRRPVRTRVIDPMRRGDVYALVRRRVEAGEQAFVVVPAIDTEGDELADLRTVEKELTEGPLRGKRVAVLHGRMTRNTREHVMGRFRAGLIDVLIATTVIEVGVDVPGATVMVVEQAERFGLAQLHQLRGRVGRGKRSSVCLLIGSATTPEGALRLGVMASTSDGFVLAERDLEIRGPGEVFGTRQSGLAPFRVADLMRDRELLAMAKRDAGEWIRRSPELTGDHEAVLLRRLLKAHGDALGLGDVG